jgi:hypothetical protein
MYVEFEALLLQPEILVVEQKARSFVDALSVIL